MPTLAWARLNRTAFGMATQAWTMPHPQAWTMPVIAVAIWPVLSVVAAQGCGDTDSPVFSAYPGAHLAGPNEAFERFFDREWPPFEDTRYGDGHMGRWITDESGRQAYEYQIDQTKDPNTAYFTSSGNSRDHWHLIGNDRIVATVHNGGYVQLYDWTRGGKIINHWSSREQNYAGGFKFIRVDGRTFNTLWERLPEGATQRRVFGQGYFVKVTRCCGLTVTERIEAPPGDDPVLLSTTTVQNDRDAASDVSAVEFWDVNLHHLTPGLVMTGRQGAVVERQRSELNRKFVMDSRWDDTLGILSTDLSPGDPQTVPGPNEPAQTDYHPKTVFLAALDSLPERYRGFAADQELFFDREGIAGKSPPGLHGAADGRLFAKRSAYGGAALLAFRRDLRLAPKQQVALRYVYGYAAREAIPRLATRYRQAPQQAQRPALELCVPGLPWLGRELLWHSYYLQAGSLYSDFFQAHFVDQGSAYGYLQGLSGAHRDYALFTLPMVYLRPDLAREMLRFSMRSQDHRTGGLPYAHVGFGALTSAVVYGQCSDLDLFLMWALSEYLAATRDMDFLKERLPFYPPTAGASGTVLDHARAAFRHLGESIGVGAHGLIRCGSGDWNDELIALSPKPDITRQKGESSLNAGLATVAMPALAGAIQDADPAFASALRELAAGQACALRKLWTGDWVARGYLGRGDDVLGKDRLFLDAQSFGVLGDVWEPQQVRRIFERIDSLCVRPQRVGAMSLWPPVRRAGVDPGSDTNGGTWAAIDCWLAWAWSRSDPKPAWDFYLSTTLAARAEAYPNCWYGIWSGPDSYNAHYHARPEGTFNFKFTPMTDFPVMNMNRHFGPLLDAIRLAGIEPRDGMIVIDPRMPFDAFAIRLPLIGAAYLLGRHRGYYTPVVQGKFHFAVRPPTGLNAAMALLTVSGRRVPIVTDNKGLVRFEAVAKPGDRITWEIR
jgi:hypothetical protein